MSRATDLPATIGRYEVLRPLGQGGMGRVILARDSVLGRQVALKLLRSDLGLPPEVRDALFIRMRHEARAAATLSHPNMVTLHDMGEDTTLGLYLVFEFIDGPTLRERLELGSLALGEVSQMARLLGDALSEAHDAGVIHRDVKPENVLLARSGPKITDFGIARLPDSTLTRMGTVLGTPAYSAPEALASSEFSSQSDQFSLAATLYEALAGQRAFAGEDALTAAAQVATAMPTPLAEISPLGHAMARVDYVLSRGLSKDSSRRYPTCRDFGFALSAALDAAAGSPTFSEAPPPSRTSIFARARESIVPRATRRVHNFAAAAALLVIVALLVFGRRTPSPAPVDADLAAATDRVSMRHVASAFASSVAPPRPPAIAPAKSRGGDTRVSRTSPDASTPTTAQATNDASAELTVVDAGAKTTSTVHAPETDAASASAPIHDDAL